MRFANAVHRFEFEPCADVTVHSQIAVFAARVTVLLD
jgi:hypothetical protein